MHVNRQLLDRHLVQARVPRRHYTLPWFVDLGNNAGFVRYIKRYRVSEARSAELLFAFTGVAMAGRAILRKHGGTPGRRLGIKCLARELQDIFGNIVDLLGLQNFIRAEGRHWRLPGIRIGCVANAMLQRRMNLIQWCRPTASRHR